MTKTHQLSQTHPDYDAWKAMRARCLNPRHERYPDYGGRGITVCDRWADFPTFIADMGPRPAGATLDRIDNDGPYSPDNCRWSTSREQARNRSDNRWIEFGGRRMVLKDWAAELGIGRQALEGRLRRGWTLERALTTRGPLRRDQWSPAYPYGGREPRDPAPPGAA